jgi:tryptophan-rich sensory protein
MWPAVFFTGSLAASLTSNAIWGSEIAKISDRFELAFTPSASAFRIWILIYTLLLAASFAGLVTPSTSNFYIFIGVSLLLTAAWTPLFTAGTHASLAASTGVLIAAACLAIAAVDEVAGKRSDAFVIMLSHLPAALYAGWLCVAAVLNSGIWWKSSTGASPPAATLLALAVGVAAAALAVRSPLLVTPAIWGLAWTTANPVSMIGIVVLAVGGVLAAL